VFDCILLIFYNSIKHKGNVSPKETEEQGVCIDSASGCVHARNVNKAKKHFLTIFPGRLRQSLDKTRIESHQACHSVSLLAW